MAGAEPRAAGRSGTLTVTLLSGAYMLSDSARLGASDIHWLVVSRAERRGSGDANRSRVQRGGAAWVPNQVRRRWIPIDAQAGIVAWLTRCARVVLFLAVATAMPSAAATYALGAGGAGTPTSASTNLEIGKRLYRKYCGQCHALTVALAAGFGTENGLGTNGGPSFDSLRVPFSLSVLAVRQPFIGHEVLFRKMTWTQVKEVSTFVAIVTKHHSVLASSTDG